MSVRAASKFTLDSKKNESFNTPYHDVGMLVVSKSIVRSWRDTERTVKCQITLPLSSSRNWINIKLAASSPSIFYILNFYALLNDRLVLLCTVSLFYL